MSKIMECLTDFFGDDNYEVVDYFFQGNVAKVWCNHKTQGHNHLNVLTREDGSAIVLGYYA